MHAIYKVLARVAGPWMSVLSVYSGCGSSTRCWRGLQVPECLFCLYILGVGHLQGVGEGCRSLNVCSVCIFWVWVIYKVLARVAGPWMSVLSVYSGCGSSTRCWRGLQVPECLFCLYILGVGCLQGVGEGCRSLNVCSVCIFWVWVIYKVLARVAGPWMSVLSVYSGCGSSTRCSWGLQRSLRSVLSVYSGCGPT